MTLHGAPASHEFDVAVSFAGEDRSLAMADKPIEAYRAFIERFAAQLEGLSQRLAADEKGIVLEMALNVKISPRACAELNTEMRKLEPAVGQVSRLWLVASFNTTFASSG